MQWETKPLFEKKKITISFDHWLNTNIYISDIY